MGFDLANYEQVKDRITRFYHDHDDGRITTELVTLPSELCTHASFKAYVYIGDILKATGYAYEAQGQGVNKDAWVENCETSAIGRALANMDYCGTLRPSQEEMSKVGNKPKPEPLPSQAECAKLSAELKLSDDEKRKLWQESGENWSNLLVMLKELHKLHAVDSTLSAIFDATGVKK